MTEKIRRTTAAATPSTMLLALAALTACSCGSVQKDVHQAERELQQVVHQQTRTNLERFESEDDLVAYLDELRKAKEKRYRAQASKSTADGFGGEGAVAEAPAAEPTASAPTEAAEESKADADESITNTQEAGVDEGGIVKAHGDHLVVLRRGRLFTVKVGDRDLRPISKIDVAPAQGHDAWYDEMLISDDTIVVVGYSYQVGATEIGLFRIDGRGRLAHRDTFFLRSNDYYSSRNYASRLIGDKLVFYMPHYLGTHWDPENPNLPATLKWRPGVQRTDDWDLVMGATDIYRPVQPTEDPVLHTVVTCELSRPSLQCNAQGILGPWGRNFYVSGNAVYVWTHEGWWGDRAKEEGAPPAGVYRLGLRDGHVGALRAWGAPVDQFSFKESSDGHLNVLVRSEGAGDVMWGPEHSSGDVAMLRVPLDLFDRGVSTVDTRLFTDLPEPEGDGYAFQNRFVGDTLLYGTGSGWGHAADAREGGLLAHPYRQRDARTERIGLPHGVDRIEAMGDDAVVVGSDGRNLHFTSIDLSRRPSVAGAFVQSGASQGELRSHGFFYKPVTADRGMLGLPIRRASEPGHAHRVHGSAEILYLGVENLNFAELGALASDPNANQDDQCKVSCVDWYGNARPIFYRGRVFALLGYELVEGELRSGRLREVDRINMIDVLASNGRGRPPWKGTGFPSAQ